MQSELDQFQRDSVERLVAMPYPHGEGVQLEGGKP
jgi:hypothetical protein